MKTLTLSAFFIMCLVQLYVPVSMILNREEVLADGNLYKFHCRPVDPNDPFRGKFVVLGFEEDNFDIVSKWEKGNILYAILERDENGFAKIVNVMEDIPEKEDYIEVKVSYNSGNNLRFELPFNRYYIEESKAKAAEDIFRSRPDVAVAFVYVNQGTAVLKKVMIGNRTIEEAAEEFMNK